MLLNLTAVDNQNVRVSVEDGVAWWVVKDVADLLGIENIRQNLQVFPDDEKGVCTIYTLGGPQVVNTVCEPGLYRLVFQSRKPEAEAFKRWVFHDVIPTLRRTGTYTMSGLLPAQSQRVREHAEISEHLLSVWRVLRHAEEPLSNREIARLAGVADRTARAHTNYLLVLGLLDLYELFPRHLYAVAEQAERRHAAYWNRLEQLAAIVERRHAAQLIFPR